jgi:hypothetical protein
VNWAAKSPSEAPRRRSTIRYSVRFSRGDIVACAGQRKRARKAIDRLTAPHARSSLPTSHLALASGSLGQPN